jgi:hypothetical protein
MGLEQVTMSNILQVCDDDDVNDNDDDDDDVFHHSYVF